jgi:hypothetical protein
VICVQQKVNIRLARWVRKSQSEFYNQTYIPSLAVFNGKLYAGTYSSGLLFEWSGLDAWVLRASPLGTIPNNETEILSLAVFNGKLYGGTSDHCKLCEWNGSDKWVEKAPQFGDEHVAFSLAVFNSKLYTGTSPNGKLLEWNGLDAWVGKAAQLGEETQIQSLAVFNEKLYAGTYPHGKLLEWNGSNAWIEKAPQWGDENEIRALVVFNERLYAGTSPHGKLLEWNGSDAWIERAPQSGNETQIRSLVVFNNKLYAGTYPHGKLLEWNGSNAWVEKASQFLDQIEISSLAVFNNNLYAGTAPGGLLFQLTWAKDAPAETKPCREIYIVPKGQTLNKDLHAITPLSYTLKRYRQDDSLKVRELDFTVDRRTPVPLFAQVIVVDAGIVIFNGYVERQTSLTKEKRRFLCKGNEAKLYHRFMPKLSCTNSITDLHQVLGDKISTGQMGYFLYNPGLLFCANSYWPPGTPYRIYDSTKNIIQLRFIDTHVDIGEAALFVRNIFFQVLSIKTLKRLTRYGSLSDLQTYNDSYFVAANKDIYIRVDGSNWYSVGGLFAENVFDTKVRLGEMDVWWNQYLEGELYTKYDDDIAALFFKLAKRHGYYVRIHDDFNYTYLDLSRSGGRVTDRTLFEKDILSFEKSSPSKPALQCAIVKGDGNQFSSVLDARADSGIFDISTYSGAYRRTLGTLDSLAQSTFNQRNKDDSWTLKCLPEVVRSHLPGDILKIKLDGEPEERLQIAQIDTTEKTTSLQLGERIPDFTDIWQSKLSEQTFIDYSLSEVLPSYSKSVTFKPRDVLHSTCAKGSVSINLTNTILSDKRLLVLLDLSLSLQYPLAAPLNSWRIAITVNGKSGDWGIAEEVSLDEGLGSVDITDLLVAGGNTIEIVAQYHGEITTAHGGCNSGEICDGQSSWIENNTWQGHPDMTANVSIRFYRMSYK